MTADRDELDVVLLSYQEVLDATKHQDDKVGRFLTAIAFLTGGAIAFATRAEVLRIRFHVGADHVHLPAWFFAGFLLLVLLAVTLLVVSLGPNLRPASPSGLASRLFFLEIAAQRRDDWVARWSGDVRAEVAELRAVLPGEVHNLATKTRFKYRSTNLARVAFGLSVAMLAVAVVLTVVALAQAELAGNELALASVEAVEWHPVPRLATALVVAAAGTVFAVDAFDLQRPWRPGPWARQSAVGLLVAVPLALGFAVAGPSGHDRWDTALAVVLAVAVVALVVVWVTRSPAGAVVVALAAVWGVLLLAAVVRGAVVWQLAVALTGLALLQVPRIAASFTAVPGRR